MLEFLKKLTGKEGSPARSTRLSGRLASYPAWHVPHLGTNGAYPDVPAPKLGEAEFRANLQAYVAAMPERIAVLKALLDEFGLDLGQAYNGSAREGFMRRLHIWLLGELPATYRPELREFPIWEPSDRSGPQIVYCLMGDIAMLFADVLLKAKPGCFVGMNLDPEDRDMTSWGRPCLLGLSDGLFPGTHAIYDFEDEMFGVYRRMKDPETGFAKPEAVAREVSGRMIGYPLLEACERFVVQADLPERRANGWMAKAT
jgi:hypothetical protein